MSRINLVAKGGAAFMGLRHALLSLYFRPEDLEKCNVILEVPTDAHRRNIITKLRQHAEPPFDPVSTGTWFGIPFEIRVKS